MCKIGDIILIQGYKDNGKDLKRHSFVVLEDKAGEIQGLEYDIICNVMSSLKNEEQRKTKLSYPGNFPVMNSDSNVVNNNGCDGFIKAEQFYYFSKDKLDYDVIGKLEPKVLVLLMKFIRELDIPFRAIIDNL